MSELLSFRIDCRGITAPRWTTGKSMPIFLMSGQAVAKYRGCDKDELKRNTINYIVQKRGLT